MLNKILNAAEPFALVAVVLAGANLAGWVEFSNRYTAGVVTFGFGILLIGKYFYQTIKSK